MQSDSHNNDPRFVEYYARESATAAAAVRARSVMNALVRLRNRRGLATNKLVVSDIGCNTGTQSRCWLEAGHVVRGLDISRDLVDLAQQRSAEFGERCSYEVGSAVSTPWSDESCDICLVPELLEHVADWESCLREAVRVLRRGGTLYISTTNILCPVQQEFALPLYSWYPPGLKRYFLEKTLTTSPHLANFASFPAFHWFSPYQLSAELRQLGVEALDRFDAMDAESKGLAARFVIAALRGNRALRFMGHVFTPSTALVGFREP